MNDHKSCRRYPVPLVPGAADGRVAEQYAAEARQTLERLAARPGRPKAMAPFDDLLGGTWRAEQIAEAGAPVVGYLCNFVPDELVLAAGRCRCAWTWATTWRPRPAGACCRATSAPRCAPSWAHTCAVCLTMSR